MTGGFATAIAVAFDDLNATVGPRGPQDDTAFTNYWRLRDH